MSDFITIQRGRKTNNKNHYAQVQSRLPIRENNGKQHFQFITMDDKGGKIGTLIRSLYEIRQKTGGGAFIIYKRATEAEATSFGEWMANQKGLKAVRSQGAGWYVWAYNESSVEKAKELLLEAEKAYSKKQHDYKREVYKKKLEKALPEENALPQNEDFPDLASNTVTPAPTTGAWAMGKPETKEEIKAPIITNAPIIKAPITPIIVKTLKKEWDAWEDDVPEEWEVDEEDDYDY